MQRVAVITVAVLATAPLLAGCGGSGDTTSAAEPTASSSAQAGAPPSGAPGAGGMSAAQLRKIRACLKAAGLDDALPTGMPTDRPSGTPGDLPSGSPPSGMPTSMPSGGPGGAGMFSEEVQQALTACGIELPAGPSGAPSSPS
ncbi:MAG: hypothetical protein U0R80_04460 [Nocardioidaceae bacterium]